MAAACSPRLTAIRQRQPDANLIRWDTSDAPVAVRTARIATQRPTVGSVVGTSAWRRPVRPAPKVSPPRPTRRGTIAPTDAIGPRRSKPRVRSCSTLCSRTMRAERAAPPTSTPSSSATPLAAVPNGFTAQRPATGEPIVDHGGLGHRHHQPGLREAQRRNAHTAHRADRRTVEADAARACRRGDDRVAVDRHPHLQARAAARAPRRSGRARWPHGRRTRCRRRSPSRNRRSALRGRWRRRCRRRLARAAHAPAHHCRGRRPAAR